MNTLFDLSGRTAVVTGARRGIGLAIAEGLARAGADIVAVSAGLEATGSEVEKRVRAAGRDFRAHRVDFADRAAVTAFAAELSGTDVDVLVNNAGTIRRAPAAEHSDEDFDHVLAVDLSSQFVLTREVGGRMLERGSDKVVFTASLLSFQGGINVPGYTAAKSGIAGLTRALANEWAGRGVNVNAIVSGYVATDNTRALQDDPVRSTAILDRIPAGRWGRPEDFVGPAVFSPQPRRTTCTARSCRSTADGWGDDPRPAAAPGRGEGAPRAAAGRRAPSRCRRSAVGGPARRGRGAGGRGGGAEVGVQVRAMTERVVHMAGRNDRGACAWSRATGVVRATPRPGPEVLDRIGGDGFVHGLLAVEPLGRAVELGAAHGAPAMITPGDTSRATLVEVEVLADGGDPAVRR